MPATNPKVTIGLPVFNGMPYVQNTLDCMLSQTFADFEIVFMDNASTDGTSDVGQEYARRDSRIRYYRNETNVGMAPNFNLAVHHTRGQYFSYTAADDLYDPEFLERIVTLMDEHPEAAIGYSAAKFIDYKGDDIASERMSHNGYVWEYTDDFGNCVAFQGNDPEDRRLTSREPDERFSDFVRLSRAGFELYGLARTDIMRQTKLMESYFSADKTLIAELTLRGTIVKAPGNLYFRRIHAKQISAATKADERDEAQEPTKYAKKKLRFPQQQLLDGLVRAVNDAPLTAGQKINCYVAIAQWTAQPTKVVNYVRQFGVDLVNRLR